MIVQTSIQNTLESLSDQNQMKPEEPNREKHYGKCHSAKTGSPRRLRNRAFMRDDTSENVLVCEATSSDAYRVCAVTDVFTALALN